MYLKNKFKNVTSFAHIDPNCMRVLRQSLCPYIKAVILPELQKSLGCDTLTFI